MKNDPLKGREILFEIMRSGPALRVTAIDVTSMTEVHIPMPVGASEGMCKQAGLQRLTYVLKKRGIIPAG